MQCGHIWAPLDLAQAPYQSAKLIWPRTFAFPSLPICGQFKVCPGFTAFRYNFSFHIGMVSKPPSHTFRASQMQSIFRDKMFRDSKSIENRAKAPRMGNSLWSTFRGVVEALWRCYISGNKSAGNHGTFGWGFPRLASRSDWSNSECWSVSSKQ